VIAFDGILINFKDLIFLPSYNEAVVATKKLEYGGDLTAFDDEDDASLMSDPSDNMSN